jgi:hypothetical protein
MLLTSDASDASCTILYKYLVDILPSRVQTCIYRYQVDKIKYALYIHQMNELQGTVYGNGVSNETCPVLHSNEMFLGTANYTAILVQYSEGRS